MSAQNQQEGPAPFRYNTRRKLRPVGQPRAFANNSAIQDIVFTPIGYAARVWVRLTGIYNAGAASSFKSTGPFNILKKIQMEANDGGVANVDFSGFGSYIFGATSIAKGFALDKAGAGNTTPHADLYAAGVAAGNNTWTLWFPVPINLNMAHNRDVGLVALQAREIQVTLKITTEDIANVCNDVGTGFSGSIDCFIESFEVPPSGVEMPPLDIIHTFETSKSFSATGYVDYELPKLGALLSITHIVTVNGALSDAIDRFEMTLNENDTPLKIDRSWLRLLQRVHTGTDLPVGVYHLDFCQGSQNLFDDDMPDVQDTRDVALLQSRIYVTDGTALGATNTVRTIRRVLAAARLAS